MKKRYLSVFLAFCMILTLLPVTAQAAIAYNIWVGGVRVTSDNKSDILGNGTVSFDLSPTDDYIITLNGAYITQYYNDGSISSGIFSYGNLRIVTTSGTNNTINCSDTTNAFSCGIYAGGELSFEGGGSLDVYGGTTPTSCGILTDKGGICFFGPGPVNAKGNGNVESYGVFAENYIMVLGGPVTASTTTCPFSSAFDMSPVNLSTANYTITAGFDPSGSGATLIDKTTLDANYSTYKYLRFSPYIAAIDSQRYTDLQAAINAVTEGKTIRLLTDINASVEIPSGKNTNFTLDLNGRTLDGGDSAAILHKGLGTLTIDDSSTGGKIKRSNKMLAYGTIMINGGSLKLVRGTIEAAPAYNSAAICNNGIGSVTVIGGTVSSMPEAGNAIYNNSTGAVNVSGGTVKADSLDGRAIDNRGAAIVDLSGGTISAAGVNGIAVYNYSSGIINILGLCTLNANGEKGKAIWNLGAGMVNISNGTLTATGNQGLVVHNSGTGSVSITGGTITPEGRMLPLTSLTTFPAVSSSESRLLAGQASYTLSTAPNPLPNKWLVYSGASGDTLAPYVSAFISENTLYLSGSGLGLGTYRLAAYNKSTGKGASAEQLTLKVVTTPGAPTIGTATAGNAQATVSFTPPASNGGATITGYVVTASPGGQIAVGTVSPITITGLLNGVPYTFTVAAVNSVGTGPSSAASNVVTPISPEPKPAATFTATGADSGRLSNVSSAMKYSLNGGGSWLPITGTSIDITGVTTENGIRIYQPGNGTSTTDSDIQTITITKASTPSLTATQPSIIGGSGSIPMTAAHEYSTDNGVSWISATGSTALVPGTYLVRVKASGTQLASAGQSITLTAFVGTKEATPAAVFTATGGESGILSGLTTRMQYKIDNGTWMDIVLGDSFSLDGISGSDFSTILIDDDISLTGLSACTLSIMRKGNGTTTTDSDIQTITITKASTPSLTATQPSIIGGSGSIPMTAAHEYSTDNGSSWISATGATTLAAVTYLVRVKANGTVLASTSQSITLTAFVGTKEQTPAAVFNATGENGGRLANVTTAMKYSLNGGSSWLPITGTSIDITGVTTINGVKLYQPGNGATTTDSDIQTITITKASTPALTATQPSVIGGSGSIPMTAAHEYSADNGVSWISATGATTLAAGTYLVRVKASGTMLASVAQSITLTAFVPTKEHTPAAVFNATGENGGRLANVSSAMKYSLNDGSSWLPITATAIDITGVTTINGVKLYQPGNGTTTTDSDIQTITITKASTPSLTATQPSIIGGSGSIPMTAAHEYSTDNGVSWISATGATTLAAGTYLVRVKASGTMLASVAQSITLTAFVPTKEQTPVSVFNATGEESGILSGLTTRMQYKIDNGTWMDIVLDDSYSLDGLSGSNFSTIRRDDDISLTGLSACTLSIMRKGNGTTTIDSDIQTITITKAITPSLTATQPSIIGGSGSIPMTAAHEYSADSGISWISATGATTLAAGTYIVRVKANGTQLASAGQSITLNVFVGTKEAEPTAVFNATGADSGTLSNVTDAMKYSLNDGSSWMPITGTTVDITGVTTTNGVKLYQPGNGTTTTDSDIQTITVTKGTTPSAGKVDCTTLTNDNGKLKGVTTEMEYKLSTDSVWTSGTGSDIRRLIAGTYLVRAKAFGTQLASESQELTIAAYSAPSSSGSSGGSSAPATSVTEITSGGSVTGSGLDQLVSSGKTLTVNGNNGTKVVFGLEALKGIGSQSSGDISFEIKDVSSEYQQSLAGKRVFSLSVSSARGNVFSFGGTATAYLPYELRAGESADDVSVWSLTDDGTMTEVPCTYDPMSQLASFTITRASLYVVGVNKQWTNPFSDVSDSDWFYGAVEHASRNGLFTGTGADTFTPSGAMTRAMLWTVLGRLDGQILSGSGAFDAARIWAMNAGITDGTDPNANVTREQMVTILWRYASSPKAAGDLGSFTDAGSVASYAADAMAFAVGNGIITGANGALMPQENATRAQVAAIMQRFINAAAK